jgi:hypothetical protein
MIEDLTAETSKSISTLKNVILHEWEVLVRDVITHSRHESSIILQDHIPHLLDQLIILLDDGRVDEVEIGKSHGYFRATITDFSIADLLTEYSLLREVLITYLYPMGDQQGSLIIHKFLDILTKHAVVEFMNDRIIHHVLPLDTIGSEVEELRKNPVIPTVN